MGGRHDNWRTSEAAILQARSHENRMTFLRTDLELCSTFAGLAEKSIAAGSHEEARRQIGHAEEGYSTILRFLSDPKHARHFSSSDIQELTAGVADLRQRLDRLKQGDCSPPSISAPRG